MRMQVYPLSDGRSVSLDQGHTQEPQIWHVAPVKHAQECAEAPQSRTDLPQDTANRPASWGVYTQVIEMVGDP